MDREEFESSVYKFAEECHRNQVDDCGKSYFHAHILQVVSLTKIVTDDINTIAAAYLHDVIEDCNITHCEIESRFNSEIADLVLELTHDGDKKSGYYFPRLKSEKAILIKFADRMSNLSRMQPWDKDRQLHYLKRSKFWKDHP